MTDTSLQEGPSKASVSADGPQKIPLSGIYRVGARRLTASWTSIPHVTHHDEADITELEGAVKQGKAASLLAEIASRVSRTLVDFPRFNAVLDQGCTELLVHSHANLGFAIDTPAGLVVAVIKECEKLSAPQIAAELARLAEKARTKGLTPEEMAGGSFTISSLGKDGGRFFTPIINAPQVAILGISATRDCPVRASSDQVEWRRMLPLSLSYDHRAINGAEAARFVGKLKQALQPPAGEEEP